MPSTLRMVPDCPGRAPITTLNKPSDSNTTAPTRFGSASPASRMAGGTSSRGPFPAHGTLKEGANSAGLPAIRKNSTSPA